MAAAVSNVELEEGVALDSLQPHPENPRQGDVGAIAESIGHHGFYGTVVAQRSTRRVLAGNHRLAAAREMGLEAVPVAWVDVDDEQALRILLVDNRTNDLASYDSAALTGLLARLAAETEAGLAGTAYDGDDLDGLLSALVHAQPKPAAGAPEHPASDALDLIFSFSPWDHWLHPMAGQLGWLRGSNSSGRTATAFVRAGNAPQDVLHFVDNPWHRYDHAAHAGVVAAFRPRWCTTRDLMTRDQCQAEGIEYYPLEQVLDWAEELRAHVTDEVIIIPKYDVVDRIPAHFRLGYSVPTTYGGTEFPAEAFAGRRVHLLGGSPEAQLACMGVLGGDVRSIDTNYTTKIALFGQYLAPDGQRLHGSDLVGMAAPRYLLCVVLSLINLRMMLLNAAGLPLDTEALPAEDDLVERAS